MTEFLNLSVPVMIRGGIQWLISTIELIWIGRLGGHEVAAAGVATTLLTFILSLLRIPSVGAISVMSQAYARGDSATAHKQFKTAVIMSFVGGLVCSVLVALSGAWLASFFSEGDLADLVGKYLLGFAWGLPAWGLMPLVQAGMVSANNAKQSMYAATGSAVSFLLMLGLYFVGAFDSMGISLSLTAVGVMTSIANWVYVVLAFSFMNSKQANLRLKTLLETKVTSQDTKAILATGVPGSMENIVTSVGLNFLLKGMSVAGPEVMHIASVGLRMLELVWLPFWYLSGAVTRFIAGKFSTRSQESAQSALNLVTLIIVIPMILISVLYLILPNFMLHVVGRDATVLGDDTKWVFILVGFYQAVTVSIMSLSAILRGLTLFTYPMRLQLISTLLICLPFLFLFENKVSPAMLVLFFVIVGAVQTYILYRRGTAHIQKECKPATPSGQLRSTGGLTT
jgi:Na+-driven multidrug efflux pump